MRYFYVCIFLLTMVFSSTALANNQKINIPILVYHNLNPNVPGSMNITPQKFEENIRSLKANGFTFIPLKEAVDYLQGKP